MLPNLGDTLTNPRPNGMANATDHSANFPIFLGAPNVHHSALQGHAVWNGNTLTITANGNVNYRFIPAIQGAISYCVLPGQGHDSDCYVISDQYGGCEYHTLYHQAQNLFAFLHVYRGGGQTVNYNLAAGWIRQSIIRSAEIAQAHGMAGSNWSVSYINRAQQPANVQSKFIHINGNLLVTGESNGNVPYNNNQCTIL